MLTEAAIQAAVSRVKKGRKATETLSDDAPKGAGRPVLIIKPGRAEWYAQRWSGGRRRLQKLGAYPALTLADARDHFREHKPASGRATLAALLDAYLMTLEGRPAHKQSKCVIESAKEHIGAGRLARDITPADVAGFVKAKFKEGKRPMAAKRLNVLSAAFNWAIKSSNDYRAENPREWGLTYNPCRDLPRDHEACKPGERFLSPEELTEVLRWAMQGKPGSARYAIALMLLTGQRVSEILRLQVSSYDRSERTLYWPWTKKGRQHTIPICALAAQLLDAIEPSEAGFFFPGNGDRDRLCLDSVRATLKRAGYAGKFKAGDFRRTWKTLAGVAGVPKYVRDLLQNHLVGSSVSSKHYDRYEAMPEKRAGVAQWECWLLEQLRQHGAQGEAHQVVQAEEHGHGQQVAAVV